MTLRIYGVPASRTVRALWTAEELGLAYELVPIDYKDESEGPAGKGRPDFRAVSPLGRIPAIDDDGFGLFESMAIDLYLARKHGKGLWPATLEGEAFTVADLNVAATLFRLRKLPFDDRAALHRWLAACYARPAAAKALAMRGE